MKTSSYYDPNKVFNTGETQQDLNNKYNYDGSQIRAIQLRMLDMLIYLDKVCKKLDVDYRLEGGTLLGAVRHGGFIPWDDDLDIAVEDPGDYKRLKNYLLSHEHPQYKLQCHETDKGYMGFWMVFRDTKSEYIQDSNVHNARKYRGLQVDIFPYSKGSTVFLTRVAHKISRCKNPFIGGKLNWLAVIIYYFEKCILHPILNLINLLFGDKKMYMHSYGPGWTFRMPEDVLFPHKPIEFEGHTFSGPAKPERFLEIQYGDWESLPPIDNRDHHEATYKIWD